MISSMVIIKRGLKNADTFKALLSKRLYSKDKVLPRQNKKSVTHLSPSMKLVPTKDQYEIQIKETSQSLTKSHLEEEVNNEIKAEKFLANAVEQSKSEDIDWNEAMEFVKAAENQYPVAEKNLTEIMDKPGVRPTYNLASIVNYSDTLPKLVDLGTKISKWEQNDYMEMALGLDFITDVAPRIRFLVDLGIPPGILGHFFSENPEIFNQGMDDLNVRVNYLIHKKFSRQQICQMLTLSDSKWLNFQVLDIDSRLGFMSKLFVLNNEQVRKVASTCPQLVIWKGTPTQLENNHLVLSKVLDFERDDLKKLLIRCPKIFMQRDTEFIQDRFEVLYLDMGYSREMIVHFAPSLNADLLLMKTRLKLLQKLGKAQVDPSKPNYVSPQAFALYNDEKFCKNVAKIPIELYNKFMQTV